MIIFCHLKSTETFSKGIFTSSKQAWDILKKTFASKTRSTIIYLKEKFSRSNKCSKYVSEYLHDIKAMANELAIINSALVMMIWSFTQLMA